MSDGDSCPHCGAEDDCSHVVTTIDQSGSDSESMTHGRIQPEEPLGSHGTTEVSQALGALYLAFLDRDPRPSAEALADALDVAPELRAIVRAEFDGAYAEAWEDERAVYVREHDGYGAWVAYVEGAIEEADANVRSARAVKGPPLMASSYGTWWAASGDGVADAVNGRLYDDAQRIRAELERLRAEDLA